MISDRPTILYLVIPCYNEEKVLPITSVQFLEELEGLITEGKISDSSRILFVDDGSKDDTWEIISILSQQDPHFIGISQSRNRGHQNALLAGLMEAKEYCDAAISMDCDGQDDIHAIRAMLQEYQNGSDIVYGVRSSRKKDSFFKRFTAEGFYKLMNHMGCEVTFNHADYRLASARVLEELSNYKEVNIFLRGMFPLVGFKSSCVYYEREERQAGKTHYPLGKMVGLAVDGITSLTTYPIHLIMGIGITVSILSVVGILWAIVTRLFGHTVDGWTSIICMVCFLSGIELFALGVIGEYVGKTYMETKARPRYIIRERTWENMYAGRGDTVLDVRQRTDIVSIGEEGNVASLGEGRNAASTGEDSTIVSTDKENTDTCANGNGIRVQDTAVDDGEGTDTRNINKESQEETKNEDSDMMNNAWNKHKDTLQNMQPRGKAS